MLNNNSNIEKNHDVLIKSKTINDNDIGKVLPISSFEQLFALSFVVDAVWVFSDMLNLDELKSSLSKTLDYYPACGKLCIYIFVSFINFHFCF